MKKKIFIIAIIFVAAMALIGLIAHKKEQSIHIEYADIIYEASEDNGYIAEKVIGNPDEAKVIVYEYADFACPHCAQWNRKMNDLIEKHNGEVALVFRNYDLRLKNGAATARAATAAHVQGYFKEYKDLLFNNQSDWIYSNAEDLNNILIEYFKTASNHKGNVEKFKEDIQSQAITKRLNFERALGKAVHLEGTPMFRINGETIGLDNLEKAIEEAVKKED